MNAVAICGYLWIAWVVVWMLWAFQSKQTMQQEDVRSRLGYSLLVWAAAYLMFSAKHLGDEWYRDVVPWQWWMGGLGIAITGLGFAIAFWARFMLGSNWSGTVTIKVGHELIRSGPYRWVRHPIYTGILVAMAGTALALDQWRGVAATALLWISFEIKRLKEEEFMMRTFGPQYVEYRRTTGAIFPMLLRRSL